MVGYRKFTLSELASHVESIFEVFEQCKQVAKIEIQLKCPSKKYFGEVAGEYTNA